jgi:signal transduction histidine kinase
MAGNQTTQQPNSSALQRSQRLSDIGLALSSSTREQLLEMIISAAAELTTSTAAFLLLLDSATGKLVVAHYAGSSANDLQELPIEGSVAGWILRQGQPVILDSNVPDFDDFTETHIEGDGRTRNLAGVPLSTRGRIIGALEVSNEDDGRSYTGEDIDFLQALASLAAVVIDNNRLLQQTDLIAEFMHELKTPLMALTAASELLARDLLDEKQIELNQMIQRETMRLSRMAQDFLDLTRLESGRAQIIRQPVDLAEVIYDVVRLQEPQAAARDIVISVSANEDLPPISGDYDRLRQVFLNLTNNAIKYNEEGGQVTINLCLQEEELLVEITDTGPGIAEKNLPHLFDRFYRIPDSEGFTKGTGLGLSIAARILQEHGGRIEVESELGKGSTFRCHLPLQM